MDTKIMLNRWLLEDLCAPPKNGEYIINGYIFKKVSIDKDIVTLELVKQQAGVAV